MKFSEVLKPINQSALTGLEMKVSLASSLKNTFSVFVDSTGNTRILKHVGSSPVSGIYLKKVRDRKNQYVINTVYTLHSERLKGHASTLLFLARQMLKDVRHSEHLTKDGERWLKSVESLN